MTDSRIADRWEGAGADELAARWGLPGVHLYARIGSTNDAARALADAGAPHGTLVLAEEQTAGRGRGGRAWSSPAGLGAWMSMVTRPSTLAAPGLLPILVGLAAADAIDPFIRPVVTQVKWPNDLHLAGRKIAGILCEGSWDGGQPGAVIVGIGLNVLHAPDDFPDEVRQTATSLRIAAGWSPSRAEVAGAVASAVARALARPPLQLTGALLEAMRRRDALEGRPVTVTGATETAGTALGVSPAGALLLRDTDGVLRTVTSGTVRIAQ
ncbi:biotin--[acetyl-CoA-carboxylase] ligase [Longimicrobium sp.]|uniref:biotin--[acetyl-CoA-carboxylase] ligase n=1 Tax=Longimicrobium sp. TaxID=2029185 RepID=UPI002E2F56B5|nr:biotin--[acetyl-CoA-carboxylase] ligase [Longimicrobium sp.]HEX6040222.1 biotin--[acetyl-CoA-carboxylase] ligase [Longimicrobium sp.]